MSTPLQTDGNSTLVEPIETSMTETPAGVRTTVTWVVLACLFLGLSAGYRAIQDRRYKEQSSVQEECPFPIERISRSLGRWKSIDEDQQLDSKTLLITGGKEYTIRVYTDDLTGVKLVVLLLFGPVEPVIPHVPSGCYPANGFKSQDVAINRKVKFSYTDAAGKQVPNQQAIVQSAVYKKSRLIEGVYHTFRYDGVWSPDVPLGKGLGRRNLGVFKLQIQRLVAEGESRDADKYREPIEDFLESLLPAIEREISLATARNASKVVTAK
jgi:hypothetical protein